MRSDTPINGAKPATTRQDLPHRRRIFTNRNLRMKSIAAIGFDMDHTLAVYKTESFNHLTFTMAIEALIRDRFDLRPYGILRMLDLIRPIYKPTAAYGAFGRQDIDLSWERTDRADALRGAVAA